MSVPGKTIAILAANQALSALLSMVLAGDSRLRVRPFDSEAELFAYMRIAPVDMLVVDFDRDGRPAYEMVEAIRLDPAFVSRDLPVIALTRAIIPPMGGLDLSPIFIFLAIRVVETMVVGTLARGLGLLPAYVLGL